MARGSAGGSALDQRYEVPEHVVFRTFAAEVVLLNLGTGQYHGLNLVGGRMFAALDESGLPADAVARVREEWPDVPQEQVERDVAGLCDDLCERGLLVRVDAG